MKRIFLPLSIVAVLFLSACVDFYPFKLEGVYESDAPKMSVVFSNESPDWDHGVLTKENNEEVTIELRVARGRFGLYELYYDEDTEEGKEVCFGSYKIKENNLILTVDAGESYIPVGTEIILKQKTN